MSLREEFEDWAHSEHSGLPSGNYTESEWERLRLAYQAGCQARAESVAPKCSRCGQQMTMTPVCNSCIDRIGREVTAEIKTESLSGDAPPSLEDWNRRFPIQDGPSIPWVVIQPHEAQAKKNHGQTLEELAKRGGLGRAELYCVMMGQEWGMTTDWAETEEKGRKLANEINDRYLFRASLTTQERK